MSARTIEGFMLQNGQRGDAFFSDKKSKDITAIASHYRRRVATKAMIAIPTRGRDEVIDLLKVTILE